MSYVLYNWSTTKYSFTNGQHIVKPVAGYDYTLYDYDEYFDDGHEYGHIYSGEILYERDDVSNHHYELREVDSGWGDPDPGDPDDPSDPDPEDPDEPEPEPDEPNYNPTITVYFHSNYADTCVNPLNPVSGNRDVIVRCYTFNKDNTKDDSFYNYTNNGDSTYMTRTGYKATGYWIIYDEDGADPGMILVKIHQDEKLLGFDDLCSLLNVDYILDEGLSANVHAYAEWESLSNIRIKTANGWVTGTPQIKQLNGFTSIKTIKVKTNNGWK